MDADVDLERVAKQLLIRGEGAWTGPRARRTLGRALAAQALKIPPARFRLLVRAVHRVGAGPRAVPELEKVLPWEGGVVESRLAQAVGPGVPADEAIRLVQDLASKVRGYTFYTFKSVDWTWMVNRGVLHADCERLGLDLERKLALADAAEAALEERLDALASHAARENDTAVAAVLAQLEAAVDADEGDAAAQAGATARGPRLSRLTPEAVATVAAHVHPVVRSGFEAWIVGLSPQAQHAIAKRIELVVAYAGASGAWVKVIKTRCAAGTLKEIKVVSEEIHYRLLFLVGVDEVLQILAFGLRRDLSKLVDEALRVVAAG